ncbi:MAG: S1 family peptidase [Pseudomonadota bacterium]
MSASKYVGRKTLVAVAVAIATAAFGAQIGAAERGAKIDPRIAAAMERDLGITAEQLPRYLLAQEQSRTKAALAERQLGADFAGAWLERGNDGEFRTVIATTSRAKAASVAGADVRQFRHSLRRLEDTMSGLNDVRARTRGGAALKGVQSWYIDVPNNTVVVKVSPGAMLKAIDFVAVSSADASTIRFEQAEGTAMPAVNVVGGNQYQSGGGYCSIGFSVTRGATKGFATAGHCGSAGTSVRIGGVTVGSVQSSSFPTNDRAWATVRSSDTLVGGVNRYNGTTVAVRGSTEYGVGTAVCRSGYASGWRCGTITATNVTVNYSNGPVYGLRQSNACLTQGDSGGSWISGNQAQGVSSGGQLYGSAPPYSNCGVANPVSYYQRINPLLSAYGLSLVLG